MTTRQDAARDRAASTRAVADRPRQRRSSEVSSDAPRVTVRAQMELREAESGLLTFEGYASITERGYEMWDFFGPYMEIVSAGAFTKTLAQEGLDVPLVLAHDQLRRLARTTNGTLTLSEDANGLKVVAQLDPTDPDVAYIAPKLRSGLIDEMSFAFRIESGQWSPDYEEYRINATNIHRGDVAIVGFGANPFTAGSGLRSQRTLQRERRTLRIPEPLIPFV